MIFQQALRVRPEPVHPAERRRVLLIGGTGFVGRAIGVRCSAAGDDVVAAGRRVSPEPSSPSETTDASDVRSAMRLDLLEMAPETIAAVVDSVAPDVVINTVGSIWGRTDHEMWDAATAPTFNLLAALRQTSSRPRLVHLGTVLEYGRLAPDVTAGPAVPPRPGSAYGRAKLAATHAVMEAHRRGDLDACVLRVSNVCGPGTPRISLLGQVTSALLEARRTGTTAEVRLRPLTAHRDYVDVRDVADAVALATHPAHGGRTFDVGRGKAVAVRDLVHLLIEVADVPARVIEAGPTPDVEDWMRVDPRPARQALGWAPTRSLRTSLADHWKAVCAEADRTDMGSAHAPA